MRKVKTGDEVIVIAGKDKGRRGTILRMLDNDRVIVEGINMVKKHVKPNPNKGIEGGIVDKEASLHISNVGLVNPATGKADRAGFKKLDDGRKVRLFKSNQEMIDA